jgi:transposase
LSDPLCRPVVLHLTPGQDADIAAAPDVLALAPPMSALLADKGYDGDDLRGEIVRRGAKPVIPNKSNRVVIHQVSGGQECGAASNGKEPLRPRTGGGDGLVSAQPASAYP